jgi:spermidine/putrescine transport system ATP-binding protein
VEQVGTPREIYDRPESRYVAGFIGETNLLSGEARESAGGPAMVQIAGARLRAPADNTGIAPGVPVWLSVRPEVMRVTDQAAADENSLTGTLLDVVFAGSVVRLFLDLPDGQRVVAHHSPLAPLPANGSSVTVAWPVAAGILLRE